jgi:hypothetical protein
MRRRRRRPGETHQRAPNITRRIDFALFMVEALTNDVLIHEAPAIVSRQAPSVVATPPLHTGLRGQIDTH